MAKKPDNYAKHTSILSKNVQKPMEENTINLFTLGEGLTIEL